MARFLYTFEYIMTSYLKSIILSARPFLNFKTALDNPPKLRHTYSTLALEGGATIEVISTALIHSAVTTTPIYVNTPNIVTLTTNNMLAKRIAEACAKAEAKEMASRLS